MRSTAETTSPAPVMTVLKAFPSTSKGGQNSASASLEPELSTCAEKLPELQSFTFVSILMLPWRHNSLIFMN